MRLENELKQRKISSRNIQTALKKIDEVEYLQIFNENSLKIWNGILEKNKIKKLKKFTDYWLRKGFEQDLIYQKGKELLR
jgi:regulatory protein